MTTAHAKSLTVREVVVSYRAAKGKIPVAIKGPECIAKHLPKLLTTNSKEHFIAFYLDAAHHIAGCSTVAIGGANACAVHPREIFQPAIAVGAVSVVVAHNHPSGSLEPSKEDISFTRQLKEAGKLLGIRVLDHIIFTDTGEYLSIIER